MKLDFSVLNPESNILDFDCGIEELNAFLKDYAMIYQNRRFGATLVFFDKKGSSVYSDWLLHTCSRSNRP